MSARRGQRFIGRTPGLPRSPFQPGVELVEQIGQVVAKIANVKALEGGQRARLGLPRSENLLSVCTKNRHVWSLRRRIHSTEPALGWAAVKPICGGIIHKSGSSPPASLADGLVVGTRVSGSRRALLLAAQDALHLLTKPLQRNLLRLVLRALGDRKRQDPIAQFGLGVVGVSPFGQRKRARERAVAPLVSVEGVALVLALSLALAADGKPVAGESDLQILVIDPRQVSLEYVRVLGLLDLESRQEDDGLASAGERRRHLGEWIPVHEVVHHAERVPDGRRLARCLGPTDEIRHLRSLLFLDAALRRATELVALFR